MGGCRSPLNMPSTFQSAPTTPLQWRVNVTALGPAAAINHLDASPQGWLDLDAATAAVLTQARRHEDDARRAGSVAAVHLVRSPCGTYEYNPRLQIQTNIRTGFRRATAFVGQPQAELQALSLQAVMALSSSPPMPARLNNRAIWRGWRGGHCREVPLEQEGAAAMLQAEISAFRSEAAVPSSDLAAASEEFFGVALGSHLTQVPTDSAEAACLLQWLSTTSSSANVNICQILRNDHANHHELFQIVRRQVAVRSGLPDGNECLFFHGSSSAAALRILDSEFGFNRSFAQNGMHGKGVYFSSSFDYSNRFAKASPAMLGGAKVMLIARVVTGKMTDGHSGLLEAPDGFDSTVDRIPAEQHQTPHNCCVFRDGQAVVEYALIYEDAA